MEPVILDTDVLSFVAKADTRAALYLPMIAGKRLCVCFQTVAELRLWVLIRHWGSSRRDALDSLINKFVVLPYDALMAQHWANIMAHRLRRCVDCRFGTPT
jgi:predicted nucleic acid-binding protein